jgi:hypothetical protein
MLRSLLSLLAVAFLTPSSHAEDAVVSAAQALFEKYVALEHAYDPKVADLYADSALIVNKRTYPTGEIRELTLPAEKYKALLRAAMPIAAARGDRSTYSDVSYAREEERVRVKATRFSELKRYSSPLSLLVGPSEGGAWLIYEELSESQP